MNWDFSDRYAADLQKLSPAQARAVLLYMGRRTGLRAEQVVGLYPPRTKRELPKVHIRTRRDGSTYLSKFKSEKQQRKVFALIAAGEVPYVRTGQLGRSITSEAKIVADGVEVTIGTNLVYAPYVIGKANDQQARIHAGLWTPADEALANNEARIFAGAERDLAAGLIALAPGVLS